MLSSLFLAIARLLAVNTTVDFIVMATWQARDAFTTQLRAEINLARTRLLFTALHTQRANGISSSRGRRPRVNGRDDMQQGWHSPTRQSLRVTSTACAEILKTCASVSLIWNRLHLAWRLHTARRRRIGLLRPRKNPCPPTTSG